MYVAKTAFHRCTVPHLQFLRTKFGITDRPRPTKRQQYVAELIRRFDPTVSEEQVNQRIDQGADIDDDDVATGVYNEQALLDFLCVDDEELVMQEAKEMQDHIHEQRRLRRNPPTMPRPVLATPLAAVPRQTIVDEGEWTQPRAKRLLPPLAKITLHTLGGTRWTISHPRFPGSSDRSKSFGDTTGFSSFRALVHLLRLAWALHTGSTGEVCPYVFEEAMFDP